MLGLDDVKYVVDENLLSLGNGMVVLRRDTARFSRPPVEDLLPRGDYRPGMDTNRWRSRLGDDHQRQAAAH